MTRTRFLMLLAVVLIAPAACSAFGDGQTPAPDLQESDEGWRKDVEKIDPSKTAPVDPGEPAGRASTGAISAGDEDLAVAFVSRGSGLFRLGLPSGASSEIGRFGAEAFTDLAYWKKKIYAVTFRDFYVLEPSKARYETVGPTGFYPVNALAVDREGKVYAAGANRLITIDPETGKGSLVGLLGPGLSSSGDLAFSPGGTLYITVKDRGQTNDRLAVVSTRSGKAELLGDTGFRDVWGLAWFDDFLYGLTNEGDLLTFDTRTGRGKLVKAKAFPKSWGMALRRP